ncbi:ABC transporter ATP-binding protein [Desulfocicer niacini]
MDTNSNTAILTVQDLKVRFHTRDAVIHAVNGISFDLQPRETLGIVGESGCGKSVMSLAMMGLIPMPPGKIESGRICYDGKDLLTLSQGQMRRIRGNDLAMIFQEPMTSLNPVLTIGQQIVEVIKLHQGLSMKAAKEKAVEYLNLVRIPEATRRLGQYPHEMSGGMRQRAMIAMALSCEPKILIADEPTTAIDVTIQAQILSLIAQLKKQIDTAIIMITHDLGVVAEMADRVIVMYAGFKVEEAPVHNLFSSPLHPYTKGLLASVPRIDTPLTKDGQNARLNEIPGSVPSLKQPLTGCAFAPRCKCVLDRCKIKIPPLVEAVPGHLVACWRVSVE